MLLLQVSLFLEIRSSKDISDSARQVRDARNLYNCDSWRQPPLPHKFAASHGSVRRRETRQRRSSALANAVCVTARASRLARIYCWSSSPPLSQWDEENPRLTALDANRLFDVVILQNCQVLLPKARGHIQGEKSILQQPTLSVALVAAECLCKKKRASEN